MSDRFSYESLREKGFHFENGVFSKKPSNSKPIKKNKSVPLPTPNKNVEATASDKTIKSLLGTNYRPHVTLKINPIGKPRMTRGDKANYREATKRYWQYKSDLNRLAIENKLFKLDDILDIEFHVAIPEGLSAKEKEKRNGMPHQETPDIDNLCKALFDCLKKQDKTIWNVKKVKYWAYQGKIIIYT